MPLTSKPNPSSTTFLHRAHRAKHFRWHRSALIIALWAQRVLCARNGAPETRANTHRKCTASTDECNHNRTNCACVFDVATDNIRGTSRYCEMLLIVIANQLHTTQLTKTLPDTENIATTLGWILSMVFRHTHFEPQSHFGHPFGVRLAATVRMSDTRTPTIFGPNRSSYRHPHTSHHHHLCRRRAHSKRTATDGGENANDGEICSRRV